MNEFPVLVKAPERIVCLVPSMTESLFDLGLSEKLVGVTDYCVLPAEGTPSLAAPGRNEEPGCRENHRAHSRRGYRRNRKRTVKRPSLHFAGMVLQCG